MQNLRVLTTRYIPVVSSILVRVLVLVALYLTSMHSYLLFHTLAEIFSIAVAWAVFMFTWNSRRLLDNGYLLFLGMALPVIGVLDLVHTISFKGMGVLPSADANLPTQLWIAARYLQSVSLLVAPLTLGHRPRPKLILAGYGVVASLLLASILVWRIFPACYVEGVGLTPFKILSEYIISGILAISAALLVRERRHFDRTVLGLLVGSLLATIASELAFTSYIGVYDLANMVGHLFKIVSVYLVYRAIVETGIVQPFNLLFRELKQREHEREEYLARLNRLIAISEKALAETTPLGLLERVAQGARELTRARLALVCYDLRDGRFQVNAACVAGKDTGCSPEPAVDLSPYLNQFQAETSIRLGGQEMRQHPIWTSLPGRGVLGARLVSQDGQVTGLVVVSDKERGEFSAEDEALLLQLAALASLGLRHMEATAAAGRQAAELATIEERQRLARDLHDAVSQSLFAASSISEVLPRIWERDPQQGQRRLAEVNRLVRGAQAEMRTLLLELRPASLVERPLGELLQQLATATGGRSRLDIDVRTEGDRRLTPEMQVGLYRIAQESLNNIIKHAHATRVSVELHCRPSANGDASADAAAEPEQVELAISDDGCGFEQKNFSADHMGLRNMRERAEAVGAGLTIDSHPGGTRVEVIWPAQAA